MTPRKGVSHDPLILGNAPVFKGHGESGQMSKPPGKPGIAIDLSSKTTKKDTYDQAPYGRFEAPPTVKGNKKNGQPVLKTNAVGSEGVP